MSLILSIIQHYKGALKMPSPRAGGANFGDALIRHYPPRHKKHAENTIYLQWLDRRNGKDAAVFGKQVLMFDKKKKRFENIRSSIKSLLCSCSPCKPFTPPSLRTSALKSKRSQGLGRF